MKPSLTIHALSDAWDDYDLLDSGNRRKLERFGQHLLIREDAKAWWKPELPEQAWKQAVAFHDNDDKSGWVFYQPLPNEWRLRFDHLTLEARFTATSKHVGVFPEKSPQWRWIAEQIRRAGKRQVRVLNLFGYTGVASLVAASRGATVTHVDSAKGVIAWAKENQRLSGLEDRPIRWIVDDASKFVKREARRERQYDAILLDPPSFGRGPGGEIWKIEPHLPELLADCRKILSDQPLFVIVTMYAIDQSCVMLHNLLHDMMRGHEGQIDVGELVLLPTRSDKPLSMSIWGRWAAQGRLD